MIQKIKSRLSCVDYLSRMGIHVKSGGRCVSPLRPGASNPTSFTVNDDFWYDFGSGHGGDVIDLAAALQYDGDISRAVYNLADELGIRDRVHFTGSQRNIPEIAALSSVVCSCNTKKPESFGRTVAEALAMNTPVVAAKHGGVLDIIREEVDGFFFTPGDAEALANVLQRVQTTTFGDLRTHIADNFTAERLAEKTLAIYHDLVAQP